MWHYWNDFAFVIVPPIVVPPIVVPPPVVVPPVLSAGAFQLLPSLYVDMDSGLVTVNPSGQADIRYDITNILNPSLTSVNGAQFGVGDRSNRGFLGCQVAAMSPAPVQLATIPVGSFVCFRTNAGRVSQFRVDAVGALPILTSTTLSYTTWQ
jgi:hypothetical protein